MFKRIAKMSKMELLRKRNHFDLLKSIYKSPLFVFLFCAMLLFFRAVSSISPGMSEYDVLLELVVSTIRVVVVYLVVAFIMTKIFAFISNYFSTLIEAINVKAVNELFNNAGVERDFTFDYCFQDINRGDFVSVKYGEHAGDYIIKPFYDADQGTLRIMVNSVNLSFDDPRYKSAFVDFAEQNAVFD